MFKQDKHGNAFKGVWTNARGQELLPVGMFTLEKLKWAQYQEHNNTWLYCGHVYTYQEEG